mgnify:CR=1 FL=1
MRPKSWDRPSYGPPVITWRHYSFAVALIAFFIIGALILLHLTLAAWKPEPAATALDKTEALMTTSEWPAVTYYSLRNVRVIDGDTLEADIDLPMRVTLRQESIRCVDYDAWEANKRRRSVNVTDEEVVKGKAATEALKSLIASGQLMVQLEEEDRDVYGRVLARLYVAREQELISVADWMTEKGHVRITPQNN